MVDLLSFGNVNSCQYSVQCISLGDRPPSPLTPKSPVAMLDSCGMDESEDKPSTLASLRLSRKKIRSGKASSSSVPAIDSSNQPGLFAPLPEEPRGKPASNSSNLSERRIWSVRSLVINIRQHIESNYTDLWVEGEISNCRAAPSGHFYFTLKDGEAQLPVVLFKRHLDLLRFRPADGFAVLVRGRLSVYESRGQLQLIAETMEPRGNGALHLAFEQLKTRLLEEGLFDAVRKRPLPSFPKCIGVITSLNGAVIRDIVTVLRRRHARLNLLVFPAIMQGAFSPGSVAAGIRWFNTNRSLVDIIVIARGGGSLEDLAGFNDEALARIIADSEIPIVSAIGHETDFTIADFIADLRAATPSAAAELITANQHRIEERISALAARVQRAGRFHLMNSRQRYMRLSTESVLTRVHDAVSQRDQRIDELGLRLDISVHRSLRAPARHLTSLIDRLRNHDIAVRIAGVNNRLQRLDRRFSRAAIQNINMHHMRLNRGSARLEALSPLAVLSRGYALIYAADGKLLRSATDTEVGQMIRSHLAHGMLEAEVTKRTIDTTNEMEINNS
jgi:exodeoxyribonuclease VII large subunit